MHPRLNSAVLSVATAAYRQFMAIAPAREQYLLHRLTVTGNRELASRVRRLTLTSESLCDFTPMGPDEYCALLLPQPGRELVLPDPEALQVARAVQKIPAQMRPEVRYYTVRQHRPQAGEIDVDVVTHGDSGPGSVWALSARPGDEVGLKEGSAGFQAPRGNGVQLLTADETALPALAAIIDEVRDTPAAGWMRAVVEIENQDVVGERPEGIDLTWVVRGQAPPGQRLAEAVWLNPERGYTSAWLCGEGGGVARLRKQLMAETGIDRRQVFSKGYWRHGRVTQH